VVEGILLTLQTKMNFGFVAEGEMDNLAEEIS